MKRHAALAGALAASVVLTIGVGVGAGSPERRSTQQAIPRLPGALLISEDYVKVREITPTGKRGPVLFPIESSARARPGGNDFLVGLDDTSYLVIELARPGERPVEVTSPPSYGPAWTPDGGGFVYTRVIGSPTDLASSANILVLRRRTRDRASERVLTSRRPGVQDTDPTWAPDGHRLAFTRSRGLVHEKVIYVLDLTTGRERRFTAGEDADWSPTGNALVYVEEDALYVIDLSNGRRRRLTSGKIDSQPLWSLDGHTIAFDRLTDLGNGVTSQVMLIPATGGRSRVLVSHAKLLDWPRPRSRRN